VLAHLINVTGLWSPGLIWAIGIETIETEFIDELQHDRLGCLVVSGRGNLPRFCDAAVEGATIGGRRPESC
jgi:hypothetical protein